MPRTRLALALMPAVVVLAACGTTAQPAAYGRSVAGGSDELSAPGTGVTAPTGVIAQPSSGGRTAAPGSARSGAGSGLSASPGVETAGTAESGTPGSGDPGNARSASSSPVAANFTGPVKVGIAVADVAAIAAVFGKPNEDGTVAPKALAAYINKHGGIGGHPIKLVIYKANSGADAATADQGACATWTQDNRIDIALGADDAIATCLAKYGIASVGAGNYAPDEASLRAHPNSILPDALASDRQAAVELQLAAKKGVLKRGSKLGVLVEDCPSNRRVVDGTILPTAKRLGVTVVQSSIQCITNLVADLVPVANQAQGAVLKFKVAGVTSVLAVSAAEAYIDAQFSGTANSQHFAPTYITSSQVYAFQNTRPGATIRFNPSQAPHIFGVGTLPQLDVGPLARPETVAQGKAQAICRKANPPLALSQPSNFFKLSGYYAMCDSFFIAKAILEENGMRFGYQDVIRGWQMLLHEGTLPAEAIVGGRYSAGPGGYHPDGVNFVREFRYSARDGMFHYVGKPVRVG